MNIFEKIKNKYWKVGAWKVFSDLSFSFGVAFFVAGLLTPQIWTLILGLVILIIGALIKGFLLYDKSTYLAEVDFKKKVKKDFDKHKK